MASNTAQTELIRKKKNKPSKANLKAFRRRMEENARLLNELEKKEKQREGSK